jgi:class 3 adenylate cyclase
MIGKVTTSIIINDYNERQVAIKDIVDLQTLNFISYMVKNIRIYNNENKLLSKNCENFIQYINNLFITKIPENTDLLKKDLLKKILPLGFDKDYIANINNQSGLNAEPEITQINIKPKQYDMVCILFTDIVNYTELARNYSDTIIFQLLNDVYIKFDSIIKKYQHLQKVETIGDAYMVVGDIFRNENNHKVVIKEIILLAFEFISEIKNIQTPDNNKLSIRIGINMGNVSIGILGSEIPRLCVVGNAVNSASRLQSTADIDTIQMSRHIYEQIEEINFDIKFDIIKKENVFLKNIGSVTTYNITPPPIY